MNAEGMSKSVVSKLTELRCFPDCQFTSQSYHAKMLDPDYYKVLLEIGVGRRFWQSNPSAENAHAFYVRVVKPLRQLRRRGVVERLQEITLTAQGAMNPHSVSRFIVDRARAIWLKMGRSLHSDSRSPGFFANRSRKAAPAGTSRKKINNAARSVFGAFPSRPVV